MAAEMGVEIARWREQPFRKMTVEYTVRLQVVFWKTRLDAGRQADFQPCEVRWLGAEPCGFS